MPQPDSVIASRNASDTLRQESTVKWKARRTSELDHSPFPLKIDLTRQTFAYTFPVSQSYGTLSPSKQLHCVGPMNKNRLRAMRPWPQTCEDFNAGLDTDYATGREITGEFLPMPCDVEHSRFDAPLAGRPQFMVNQLDRALVAEKK